MDRENIAKFCLQQYFVQENLALQGTVELFRSKTLQQAETIDHQAAIISRKNRHIAELYDVIHSLVHDVEHLQREDRILIDTNGNSRLFRRNSHGHFVQVVDPPAEEPIREVRRRLDFDSSDTESELEDEFMEELMFG